MTVFIFVFLSFPMVIVDEKMRRERTSFVDDFFRVLDRMKCVILLLVSLVHWSVAEQLLGGWSTATDPSLIEDCLRKGLASIRGGHVNNDELSQASDVVCKTQIVNGMNIRLTFVLDKQRWRCTYYKSFIATLDTQLEECKQLQEEVVEAPKSESTTTISQERVVEANDDEQPAPVEKNDEEQEEKLNESPKDNVEDDDEAKIDALKQQLNDENVHNDNHEEQTQ